MKIIAKREAILSPLQAVIGVVERKQTMPILANVLVSAKGGKLSITATDLEVELVATSDVDVQRGGEITIPGRKLLDICRALPEGTEITLTQEGERMLVRARKSRFTLRRCRRQSSRRSRRSTPSRPCSCRRRTSSGCSTRPISRWPSRTCATT